MPSVTILGNGVNFEIPNFYFLLLLVLQNLLVYDWQARQMSIGPFTYDSLPNLDMLLRLPGEFYRKVNFVFILN